jgi:hypothetical protein
MSASQIKLLPASFIADLVDITAGNRRPTEPAEIPADEIGSDQLGRIELGSIFRWAVGYQRNASGTRMRYSNIVFRTLPPWTPKDKSRCRV